MISVNIHKEVHQETETNIVRHTRKDEVYDVLTLAPEVDIFLHPMQTEALMRMLEEFKANNYTSTTTQCTIPELHIECTEF